MTLILTGFCIASAAAVAIAAAPLASANGHGTLLVDDGSGNLVRRQFSFSARQLNATTGAAQGNAVLHNPAFTGENGHSPYMLQIDIQCMKVFGNIAFFGGSVKKTNDTTDPVFLDAVFFSVQDNGEPGKNKDLLSPVFFWDDQPPITGDPMACNNNAVGDFAMDPIEAGNIQVK
jgi:hypothetical protein